MSDLNFHARTAIAARLRETTSAVLDFSKGEPDSPEALQTALSKLRFQSRITGQIAPLEARALHGAADLVDLATRGAGAAATANNSHRYDERCREALKVLELAREVILPKD